MGIIETNGITFHIGFHKWTVYKYMKAKVPDGDIFHLYLMKTPEVLSEILANLDKAINERFDEIEDPDISNDISVAFITPTCVEFYDVDVLNVIRKTPLIDYRDKVDAWRSFLLKWPHEGNIVKSLLGLI